MSLQAVVAAAFIKHVFGPLQKPGSWKVLVMDDRATKVVSSVFRMQDLTDFGITPCPRDILNAVAASNCIRYAKTLSQLDLDFIPIESSLFSFDCQETGLIYSISPNLIPDRQSRMEQLAEQLATVCVTLQEYPRICYRKTENNLELARLAQLKLDAAQESNPGMGQGPHKERSILMILDRGFDPISPLLHELTLQAMCYDLLNVTDNVYTYGDERKANVTDQDPLWKEIRHSHIADVTKTLPQRVREFAASKKQFTAIQSSGASNPSLDGDGGYVNEGGSLSDSTNRGTMKLRELSNLIKQMPQYQAEAASYTAAYSITEECMKVFRQGVDKLCGLEQDLVMGQSAQGEPVRDPMRLLSELFKYDFASVEDRLRMLMIFVLIKEGVSESHLEKLLATANVERLNKVLFASLSLVVGAQLIQPESNTLDTHRRSSDSQIRFGQWEFLLRLPPITSVADKVQSFLPTKGKRKDRVDSDSYAFSRWTPYLMDVLEEAIQDKMKKSHFAFLVGRGVNDLHGASIPVDQSPAGFRGPSARFQPSGSSSNLGVPQTPYSFRSPSPSDRFGTGNSRSEHCGPRLIVCIIGGVTWSEARTAYQVTQKCIETRLAESDRQTGSSRADSGRPSASSVLPGGGGIGWNWEVMIGGTHIITPGSFVGDLNSMYRHFMADMNPTTQAVPQTTARRASFWQS